MVKRGKSLLDRPCLAASFRELGRTYGVRYILYGLLCLLFFAPFMFGAVEPWSLALIEAGSFSLFFTWILVIMRSGGAKFSVIKPPFLFPLGVLVCIAVLQITPLPPSLLKTIAPQTYKVYQDIAVNGEMFGWRTLSLYPHATVLEIVRFLSCICVYILALQLVRDRHSIDFVTMGILVTGVCVALTGIFQFGSSHKKLLWFREVRQFSHIFGPYVNRNHFAGLMELLIPVAMSMSIYLLPLVRNRYGHRALISEFLTHTQTNRLILYLAGAVIMITGLFLSASRGGITGFCSAMVVFGTMLLLRPSTRKKGWLLLISFIIILLSVGWFGWMPIIERFVKTTHADTSSTYRLNNWKDSFEMIGSFPSFGSGLGTYEHIFPRYRKFPGPEKWEHAHNEYLEGAIELGIPGLITGLYIVGRFYVVMVKVLRQRRSSLAMLLGIGGMAGITGMLIHNLVDFNLHIGANALFFSFLFGYTLAVSHASTESGGSGTLLEQREISVPPKRRRPVMAVMVTLWLASCSLSLLPAVAELYYFSAEGPLGNDSSLLKEKRMLLEKGSRLSPLDARFPFAEGSIDTLLRNDRDAIRNYTRAVMLNPVQGEYLRMLGLAYAASGETARAGQYLKLAVTYAPASFQAHKNYASWLLSRGKKEEGTAEMKKAISLDPVNIRTYIAAMVLNGLSPSEAREGIPETSAALAQYGTYRQQIGDTEDALGYFHDALILMKKEGRVTSELYYRIAGIYEKQGQFEKALACYQEGVSEIPSDVNLRLSLARVYENLRLFQKAGEEYERILQLAPSNEYVQRKIRELEGR
jgi:tetratricopeptide (TPR) repeat protein/O-antigen ligase